MGNRSRGRSAFERKAKSEKRGGQYKSNLVSGPNAAGKREDDPAPCSDPDEDLAARSNSPAVAGVRALGLLSNTNIGKAPGDADMQRAPSFAPPEHYPRLSSTPTLPEHYPRVPNVATQLGVSPLVLVCCPPAHLPRPPLH